jgi:DNA-binding PadR family transcriptional regulator
MLEEGWLADGWEEQPRDGWSGRPPRRYYQLTSAGKTELAILLEQARDDPRFRSLFPPPKIVASVNTPAPGGTQMEAHRD